MSVKWIVASFTLILVEIAKRQYELYAGIYFSWFAGVKNTDKPGMLTKKTFKAGS